MVRASPASLLRSLAPPYAARRGREVCVLYDGLDSCLRRNDEGGSKNDATGTAGMAKRAEWVCAALLDSRLRGNDERGRQK